VIHEYLELRRDAVRLPDNGGYSLDQGEMNPEIYKRFLEIAPGEIWEPFANPDGRSFAYFDDPDRLLASTLISEGVEAHPDIMDIDATSEPPASSFDGIVFHPPYFGSRMFSSDPRDISGIDDEDEWRQNIENAADIAVESLSKEGIICVVGRRYRHGGKEIRLDEWLVESFCGDGLGGTPMQPVEVWFSVPDVAIILRRRP
jgi:hypothetical protein